MPTTSARIQSTTYKRKSDDTKSPILIELIIALAIFTTSVGIAFFCLSMFEFFESALYEHISGSLILGGLIGVLMLVLMQKIKRQ